MKLSNTIEVFGKRAETAGTGNQALIDAPLRDAVAATREKKPLPVTMLRRVLREELPSS